MRQKLPSRMGKFAANSASQPGQVEIVGFLLEGAFGLTGVLPLPVFAQTVQSLALLGRFDQDFPLAGHLALQPAPAASQFLQPVAQRSDEPVVDQDFVWEDFLFAAQFLFGLAQASLRVDLLLRELVALHQERVQLHLFDLFAVLCIIERRLKLEVESFHDWAGCEAERL